ncbi:HlyD family efflux transporter periplasmic adaptor subunit [Winogradskyella sp.]|uniref:efflux RND transporter periplasmic adaptor subunit n=1 Tax=Winogradskyella sp. TaxID=1883156 RepID=UPI0026176C1F|nr:HlyD family efflux transporter periplasmic adaptor subunit [Winogradskyella sp.]
MRKYLSAIIGIALIILGVLVFNLMNSRKNVEVSDNTEEIDILPISVKLVELTNIPYVIEATGILKAKERIEIYSEVQGILKSTKTPFKIGNSFQKGESLIIINSDEHLAQIKSSRSDLMNQIAAMLPDMEIDYPNVYKKWEAYLEDFDLNASRTQKLPSAESNKEKLFVSGKNIYNSYYNLKNLEERLSKYYINAPYNGIVTESNVNVGTLIRSGQKLGEFIDNSRFELEISVPATENKFLKKNTEVGLVTIDKSESFKGLITRINGKIDQSTQTINVIVGVKGDDLKDGQYLTAQIRGNDLTNVFKIDNALILENNNVYVVEDNRLQLKTIEVVNYQGNMAVVTGLEHKMLLANEKIANAYPGMPVKINNGL